MTTVITKEKLAQMVRAGIAKELGMQKKITTAVQDAVVFLANDPKDAGMIHGSLTSAEAKERMEFAQSHASPRLTAWLEARNFSVEDFVNANPCDRSEFLSLLTGKFLESDGKSEDVRSF